MNLAPYHILDARRKIVIPGDAEATITFAVNHWMQIANESIQDHGFFAVALSGGSTPKKIFQQLRTLREQLDWTKVYIFWSDERSVPPTHSESNYFMAMHEAGLELLPIPKEQIFRMVAESDIEHNAKEYENIILDKLGAHPFDLVMLGMGDDGHTASLFPHTLGLKTTGRLVIPNFIAQKNTWRMTFTYECINRSRHISLYVLGEGKTTMVEKVLYGPADPLNLPSQLVGTPTNPALWILDSAAAKNLFSHLK